MNDNLVDRYRALVESLYRKTYERKLKWEMASYSGTYSTQLGDNAIHLSTQEGPSDEPDMVISIYNGDGMRVDGFNDQIISGEIPSMGKFKTYWSMMHEIYLSASRQALRADEVLDELLNKLRE